MKRTNAHTPRPENFAQWTESQRAREFREASIAVWREIDRLQAQPGGYKGLAQDTDLRIKERRAWERYREELDRG